MDELKHYRIQYTETAEDDVFSKAEYIATSYHDRELAYTWYTRLSGRIQKELSFLRYKYQLYTAGSWAGRKRIHP